MILSATYAATQITKEKAMPAYRTDAASAPFLTLAIAATLSINSALTLGQATQPSGTISLGDNGAAATTALAPMEANTVTQPFVGTVTADKVYVRSGPGSAYYEMGQLTKGDTVQVVGSSLGWYKILP